MTTAPIIPHATYFYHFIVNRLQVFLFIILNKLNKIYIIFKYEFEIINPI